MIWPVKVYTPRYRAAGPTADFLPPGYQLVDSDTPPEAHVTKDSRGRPMHLVFSDEVSSHSDGSTSLLIACSSRRLVGLFGPATIRTGKLWIYSELGFLATELVYSTVISYASTGDLYVI